MKLIVPMAGRGTRLRPHTHVTPKPLMPIVGKSMVERIVTTFNDTLPAKLEEAVFVLGPDFGDEVREQLREICRRNGMDAHFAVQETALGTAHAVHAAHEHLDGECLIVFADTLFYMEPDIDFEGADAVIWVKEVDDPSRFGVAVREGERVTAFVEKPKEPISNEAIIGIYWIREGEVLRKEIDYLLENNVTGVGGEYQLTDALDRMLKDGKVFKTASVTHWLDAGTIPALRDTTRFVLEDEQGDGQRNGEEDASVIIEPVYIGEGARIVRSVVGPNAAIEAGAVIEDSVVRDAIVFANAHVRASALDDALIGRDARVAGVAGALNVGDHSTVGRDV